LVIVLHRPCRHGEAQTCLQIPAGMIRFALQKPNRLGEKGLKA
jgi:hypothetical protein